MTTKTMAVLGLLALCALIAAPTAAADDIVIISDTDGDGDCEATTLPGPPRSHTRVYLEPCTPGGE